MLRNRIPILKWLPSYKKEYLVGDISAGITVGIMLIPQGMAYYQGSRSMWQWLFS